LAIGWLLVEDICALGRELDGQDALGVLDIEGWEPVSWEVRLSHFYATQQALKCRFRNRMVIKAKEAPVKK